MSEIMIWTDKWPTEEGTYWFYGYRFHITNDKDKPELFLVEVWKLPWGIVYATRGYFLYREEGGFGLWTPADLPPVPEDMLKIILAEHKHK